MSTQPLSWFEERTWQYLPQGWFPSDGAIINAVVGALSEPAQFNFGQLGYVAEQTRIATACDGFLDLAAEDYFGAGSLPRRASEADAAYRVRIQQELLRPKGTRAALVLALTELTGKAPSVFEPNRPADCAGLGSTLALGTGLPLGSRALPYQFFVSVKRPAGSGIPNIPGLGGMYLGRTAGLGDLSMWTGLVPDAEIYSMVSRVIPAGTTAWVSISS